MTDERSTGASINYALPTGTSTFSAVLAGLMAAGPITEASPTWVPLDIPGLEFNWDAGSGITDAWSFLEDSDRELVSELAALAASLAARQVPLGRDIEELWDANTDLLYQS